MAGFTPIPPRAGANGITFFTGHGAKDVLLPTLVPLVSILRQTCHAIRQGCDEELQGRWAVLSNFPPEGPFLNLGQEIRAIDAIANLHPMEKLHRISQLFENLGVDRRALFRDGYLPCQIQDIARLQEALNSLNQDRALEAIWPRILQTQTQQPVPYNMCNCQTAAQMRTYLAAPANLATIIGFRDLNLSELNLNCLPPEIGHFIGLLVLNLDNNQLATLPVEIGNLVQLQVLALDNNQLTALPVEIGNLVQLQRLELSNNRLVALPAAIGTLVQLQRLALSNNQLAALPVEIGNLVQLWKLNLNNNQLVALPAAIGNLVLLEMLGLRNNQLVALPAAIGNLVLLQMLGLGNNQLTALPIEIGNLVQLQQLALDNNPLTALPVEIGNLVQLQRLILSAADAYPQ